METIEGIVLKQMDYKESSKIIYVYTASGKVSVLVHGSNKLKSPYLNLVRVFSHVRLIVSGKTLKTLRDGQVINYYTGLSNDLNKYTYAVHLMEVVYYFSDHDHDHEKYLRFLLKIFDRLKENNQFNLFMMMAELKLLFLLGVQPLFKHCVHCQKQKGLSFSVEDGGMVCDEHHSVSRYRRSTIELMMTLYYYDMDQSIALVSDIQDEIELRHIIDEYYEYHLNYRGRSRKMLKEILGY